MSDIVLIAHILVSLLLVAIILFQGPKGEGLGAIGGSARLFHGPRPRETLMVRVTTVFSILFVVTVGFLTFVR